MSAGQGIAKQTPLGGGIVDGLLDVPTAGTAVRITTDSTPCLGIWVSAQRSNTDVGFVGASTVKATSGASRGIPLFPGNPAIFLPVKNVNLLFFDVAVSGEDICFAYITP